MAHSVISPHPVDRIASLRAEVDDMLALARSLSEQEWHTPSAAQGWRVQEVIAHVAAACHGSFTPWLFQLMRSPAVERSNDADVDARRDWPPARVLAEYERWSPRLVRMQTAVARTPVAAVRVPLGELGRYPLALFGSAFVFDHWTHRTQDVLPALGRPTPVTDENRAAVVLEWLLDGLEQMNRPVMGWVDRLVGLTLAGPGGGSWVITPAGDGRLRVRPGDSGGVAGTVARISGRAEEFPIWSTRRKAWRDCDVRLAGDTEYATRFLDTMRLV